MDISKLKRGDIIVSKLTGGASIYYGADDIGRHYILSKAWSAPQVLLNPDDYEKAGQIIDIFDLVKALGYTVHKTMYDEWSAALCTGIEKWQEILK